MNKQEIIDQQDKDIASLEERLNRAELEVQRYKNLTHLPSAEATASLLQRQRKENDLANRKLQVFVRSIESSIALLKSSE